MPVFTNQKYLLGGRKLELAAHVRLRGRILAWRWHDLHKLKDSNADALRLEECLSDDLGADGDICT